MAATKSDVRALARKVYGDRADAESQRTAWNTWRVRIVDDAKSPAESGRVRLETQDYPSVGRAYAEAAVYLRAELVDRDAARPAPTRASRLAAIVEDHDLREYEESEDGVIEPLGRFVMVEHCPVGDYCWLRFSDTLEGFADIEDGWTPLEATDLDTGDMFSPRLAWSKGGE